MKELPEDFRKMDGMEMYMLSYKYFPTDGMQSSEHIQKITYNSHSCPAEGCDFILGGSSCSSKSVFELHGAGEPLTPITVKRATTLYLYCLPENVDVARAAVIEAIRKSVRAELSALTKHLEAAEKQYAESFE